MNGIYYCVPDSDEMKWPTALAHTNTSLRTDSLFGTDTLRKTVSFQSVICDWR